MQVQRKERSIPQTTSAALTILCRQILYEVASLMELFLCVIAHFWHVYPNTRAPRNARELAVKREPTRNVASPVIFMLLPV
jgi:hypothetical protein